MHNLKYFDLYLYFLQVLFFLNLIISSLYIYVLLSVRV